MQSDRFSRLLKKAFEDTGMTKAKVMKETEYLYGRSQPYLNETDVRRLLSGEGLTKVRKLAVLVDVLGLSHGEIALLLRSTLPERVSQAANSLNSRREKSSEPEVEPPNTSG